MNVENHYLKLKESINEIERAIMEGIMNKQRTIGFHTSAAAADMYEIILHRMNLITAGFVVKHEWFASKNKIKDRLPYDFPAKKEVISLISAIETERNKLCYGKPRSEEEVVTVIELFNQLKEKFIAMGYGHGL